MRKTLSLLMATAFAVFIMTSCGGGNNKKASMHNESNIHKKEMKQEAKKETKNVADISAMTADKAAGEKIYKKYCIACHMTGVAGAAKLDNKARWTESASKGLQTLVNHALHGYQGKHGVLPEKGTCSECQTQDILNAVSYMLDKAGVTAK